MEYRNFGFGFIRAAIGGGSGGGGGSLNLFTQMEEPEIKDGIWIKTDSKYKHIVCNGKPLYEDGAWGDVLTSPFNENISAVVYNNEVHLLDYVNRHYKLNSDGTWSSVSTQPLTSTMIRKVVVFNNEIHAISKTQHYKFDGSTWTSVSTPYADYPINIVVYNNEIHVIYQNLSHYKFDGTSWSKVSTVPINTPACCVVYNDCIHIIGSSGNYSDYYRSHYKLVGSTWTSVSKPPYNINNSIGVVYNNDIHILGGGTYGNDASTQYHYKFNDKSWTKVSTIPTGTRLGACVSLGYSIYMMCGDRKNYCVFTSPQALFENQSIILVRSNHNGVYLTNFCDVSAITGENKRFLSGFDDVWYFDNGSFDLNCEMYYGNGNEWVKFKN